MRTRNVIVAGATGLVGTEIVRQLAACAGVHVSALVRRSGVLAALRASLPAGRVDEVPFGFDAPSYARLGGPELPCDALFCAVGTTMKKAGSEAAFRSVDEAVPLGLLAAVRARAPEACFSLVSSVGADKPTGFYLKVKHEVEAAVFASGLAHVIVRPSVLLGARGELRPGERLATLVMPPVFGLLAALGGNKAKSIGKYRPIAAVAVARSLIKATMDTPPTKGAGRVLEGWEID